jgi:hypothetical protein
MFEINLSGAWHRPWLAVACRNPAALEKPASAGSS